MGKEKRYETSFEGPYSSIGWEGILESKFIWNRGPRLGQRMVSYPHVIDLEGNRHDLEPQRGPWTWYNWRFKRIEGPKLELSPTLTFRSDQEKTTAGIELEGRPDAITQRRIP